LPEGDYNFIVTECDKPYLSQKDNWVLRVVISIPFEGEQIAITAWPWSRSEQNNTDGRDDIGDFLLAVNRASKKNEAPDWPQVIGAKGKCRLRQREGTDSNEVHYFYKPKQVGPAAEQEFSKEEFARARKQATAKAGAPGDLEDIPF
jgi:hypothetical protein